VILALDVGSSSVRAAVHDERAEPIASAFAQVGYDFVVDADGAAESDPDAVVELVARAIDGALARGVGVEAVATCTFWHGLMGVDAAGTPTTPLFSWADRRAASAVPELRQRVDDAALHARTGCVPHSSYWPAKLLWLRATRPDAIARTARFVSFGEYLAARLFGEWRVGVSMASATGLFDPNRLAWDAEVLAACGVTEDRLSPLSDAPFVGLREPWASRWPALSEVPWFPAAGDGACSNLGSGCVTRDRAALMVGTSGAMRVLFPADRIAIPAGLWCYRADRRRFVVGGALSDGGNLVAWLGETLRLPDGEERERQLAAGAPSAHGLTFLPLLGGERGPGWADRARGAVLGMSMATRPLDIYRAALEGVALRFALIARIVEAAFPGVREIVATGGGLLRSPAWIQICADALGRPMIAAAVPEASSRGACLLALESLGRLRLEDVPAPLGETYTPDPARHAHYREAQARQEAAYRLLV
jgi:gluconokinase